MHALLIERDPRVVGQMRDVLHLLDVSTSTVGSVAESLAIFETKRFDIVVAEIPAAAAGRRAVALLVARCRVPVVFVLAHLDEEVLNPIADAQAGCVLCKPFGRPQLEATLRLALRRRNTQTPASSDGPSAEPGRALASALEQIAAICARYTVRDRGETPEDTSALLTGLRPRESQVVRLLLKHYRVPAIAQQLRIRPQTVRNHLKAVYRRLGVRSQQELLDRLREPATTREI